MSVATVRAQHPVSRQVRAALLEPQLRELESAQLLLEGKQRELAANAQRADSEARRLHEVAVELRRREHAVRDRVPRERSNNRPDPERQRPRGEAYQRGQADGGGGL